MAIVSSEALKSALFTFVSAGGASRSAYKILAASVVAQLLCASPAGAQLERRRDVPNMPRAGAPNREIIACAAIAAPRPKASSYCSRTQPCTQANGRVGSTCTEWKLIR